MNDGATSQSAGTLTLSPENLDLGTVTVNHSIATEITASNPGPTEISITGITLSDTENYGLDLQGGPNPLGSPTATLHPGESGTFTVSFQPLSAGDLDVQVTIEYDETDTTFGTQSFGVQGKGGNPGKGKKTGWYKGKGVHQPVPNIKLTPRDHDFGDVVSGSVSTPLEINVANEGVADLNISDMTLSDTANFSLDMDGGSNPCGNPPATIPPGQSRTVTKTFSPYSTGSFDSVLTVLSNDPDPTGNDVHASGNAVSAPVPHISVSPGNHSFGDIPTGSLSAPAEITITNTGTADLAILDMSLSETTNFYLDVSAGNSPCGSTSPTISPGQNCSVAITFNPFSTGTFNALLSIDSNDSDSPTMDTPLDGNGTAEPPSSDVTLAWDASTHYDDGTPLTDLAGYTVYYGTYPGNYSHSVDVGNVTQYMVTNLTPGTWYFSVTSSDTAGFESNFSNEVSAQVN